MSHQQLAGRVCAPEPPGDGALSQNLASRCGPGRAPGTPAPSDTRGPLDTGSQARPWAERLEGMGARGGGGLESPGPSRCEQPPAASPPHFGGNGVALGCDCEQHRTLPLLHGCRGCAAAIPAPGVQRPFPFTAPCPGGAPSPPANGEITQAPGRAQPAALTSGPSCLSRGRCLGPYGHRSPGWAGRGWGGLAGRRGCWDRSKRQHPPGLPAAAAEGLLPLWPGLVPGGLGRE